MKNSQSKIFIHINLKFLISFYILLIFTINVKSQSVFIPIENGVYEFLERMDIKGIIKINDETRPFSRKYVAEKLIEVEENLINTKAVFSKVDINELEFYKAEYFFERNQIKDFSQSSSKSERWFLYSYSDSLFNLKVSPVVGYGISATNDFTGHTRWIGASTFGTYSNWFGFSFDLRDKGEFGDNIDKTKYFSPSHGAWTKNAPNGIEYTDVKGSINFSWDWGNVSLIKDYTQWGHGKFGQLILSDKAPSYPQIRLQLNPTSWLRFNYMHGWLSSQVYDSAYFYNSYPNTISQTLVKSYIPKYTAANMLTVTPIYWFDVSLGNAVVYGGNLRPEFFIPFMFYKFLDHNSGRGDVNDANGMMYFDLSAKYPKNFQFYGTAFIDVTEIRNILDNDFENTWIGFTVGGKTIDLLFDNLDLTIEYTRLNPWVYEHKNEVTNYKHLKYSLGHWLGQNADQLRLQFNYQFIQGLKIKLYSEFVRKGGMDEIYYAYSGSDEKNFQFLYSPLRSENRFGLEFTYEYLHDFILKGTYIYSEIKDEEKTRQPIFLIGSKNSFSITLFYGI